MFNSSTHHAMCSTRYRQNLGVRYAYAKHKDATDIAILTSTHKTSLRFRKALFLLSSLFLLNGCISTTSISNVPKSPLNNSDYYGMSAFSERFIGNENSITLAFSGGGMRAAALSYGVLKALESSPLPAGLATNSDQVTLLDEVDTISAVSGGSFTAAYYGLFGKKIFEDYEAAFLRRNVETQLYKILANPLNWFSRKGRTDRAIDIYERDSFGGAVFRDFIKPNSPFIIINASDLAYGSRFAFIQEYFDLLCSDISDFSVAKAVAASAAVPVLVSPVTLENYDGCVNEAETYIRATAAKSRNDPELELTSKSLMTFADKGSKKYVHLVDGGITDNLGLRTIVDLVEISSSARPLIRSLKLRPTERSVIISVDASTKPTTLIGENSRAPSISTVISATSSAQLHHYNVTTIALTRAKQKEWAKEVSNPEHQVETYFIQLDLTGIKDRKVRHRLNQITTSMSLDNAEVDSLINAGRSLLLNNLEFQRLMRDLAEEARQQ